MVNNTYWRFVGDWGFAFKFVDDNICMTIDVAKIVAIA
jgi:hypothetical protein